jgi:hypothetical protein
MAFTFTTSGAAIKTAGANVNASIVLDVTQLEDWSDKIENELCSVARYDCISNYTGLTTNGKEILGQIEDAKIAQLIINYEPEAIGTIGATLRLNLLQNIISQGVSNIEDGKIKSYLAISS